MSRLAWFKFYPDDYLGGTRSLACAEHGAYLLLLLVQWGTKDVQAIPDIASEITLILGQPLSAKVRAKFSSVVIDGKKYLRNQRLAKEWFEAKEDRASRQKGAKKRWNGHAEHDAEHSAEDSPEHSPRARAIQIPDTRRQKYN